MVRNSIRQLLTAACIAGLPISGFCQQSAVKPKNQEVRERSQVASRLPVATVAQLSDSLEELARKIFPGVVQIEVTGFRPAEDDSRKDSHASALVRERTVGAGMIVDPDGYIMTNAHVVAGTQRIRLVFPEITTTLFNVSDIHNAQVLGSERNFR